MFKKNILTLAGTSFIIFSGAATAQTTQTIDAVPTDWRIQSYGSTVPVLWFTGSSCSNGQITVDPSISVDTQKTIWAAILAAKAANLKIYIDYTVSGSNCIMTDFGVDGPG